ncbi:MAG TPA: APC family permease [Solirubrobacteraceae bacterium]
MPAARAECPDKGLKRDAIGYLSNLVIAVASVAPGYSIAATLGFVVAVAGLQAPAVFIVAFVPMLLVAYAYRYFNRADPDAGTTFSWVTRAFGPGAGWLGGWAIVVADVVVMANLAAIAGSYTFLLVSWDSAASSTAAVTAVGVLWIVVMTAICYIGIELNARTQRWLLSAEVVILAVFAVWALVKAAIVDPAGSVTPSLSWINPFAAPSASGFFDGILLAVFIYWGWDSGVAVNEESRDRRHGPGKAAVLSTIILLGIYVIVSVAAQAYAGPKALVDNSDDVLSFLGGSVFPSPLDKALILAVLTSAAASTQTTILPTARTTLSMARHGALPRIVGRVHPRFQTPDVSTLAMGLASIAFYVILTIVSEDVLGDSIVALGFLIAFYYGLTGIACAWYYRGVARRGGRALLLAVVAPLAGGVMLFALFGKALVDYSKPANVATSLWGIGTPVWIGVGSIVAGVIVMLITRALLPTPFWRRRTEQADPELVA